MGFIDSPDLGSTPAAGGFGYDAAATSAITSRVRPLAELIEDTVSPGSVIHFPWVSTRAYGALFEIIRQIRTRRLSDLTVVSVSLRAEVGLLAASGGVKRVITSFAATTYPSIRPNSLLRDAVKDGRVEVEEWSLLSLIQRVLAGAMDWPFVPNSSMSETDLPAGGGRSAVVTNPFDGTESVVIPALRPDVAIIHCPVADTDGNGVLFPPYAEDIYTAYASRQGVILTADQIVTPEALRAWSSHVKIPAARVIGVAHLPLGAHPSASPVPVNIEGTSGYGEDYEFLRELGEVRTEEAAEEFCRTWIDVTDRREYLRQLGPARIEHLLSASLRDSWQIDGLLLEDDRLDQVEPTVGERLAVSGARALVDLAAKRQMRTVVAGAGVSSLAAALGRVTMLDQDRVVDLVFEAGVLGYVPRPYDSTLSNSRNLATARHLSSALEVLGMLLPTTQSETVAVLSAGVIDSRGNANSNRSQSGDFLVGGGGSTDIASHVATIGVVAADPRKFVADGDFTTYPGDQLTVIATEVGHLHRQRDRYVLGAWFADAAENAGEALAIMRDVTGWDLEAAQDIRCLPGATSHELHYLRNLDPDKNLLD